MSEPLKKLIFFRVELCFLPDGGGNHQPSDFAWSFSHGNVDVMNKHWKFIDKHDDFNWQRKVIGFCSCSYKQREFMLTNIHITITADYCEINLGHIAHYSMIDNNYIQLYSHGSCLWHFVNPTILLDSIIPEIIIDQSSFINWISTCLMVTSTYDTTPKSQLHII